ncbi:hypothetical protein [Nonomuraea salmonea]|uniref:hypothetical protein n=1 Tax=Nonomuraea salmonea TaxID=46181 RepID=UPI0031F0B5B5
MTHVEHVGGQRHRQRELQRQRLQHRRPPRQRRYGHRRDQVEPERHEDRRPRTEQHPEEPQHRQARPGLQRHRGGVGEQLVVAAEPGHRPRDAEAAGQQVADVHPHQVVPGEAALLAAHDVVEVVLAEERPPDQLVLPHELHGDHHQAGGQHGVALAQPLPHGRHPRPPPGAA